MDLFVVDIEFENLNVEQLNYLTRCVIGRWLLLASKGDLFPFHNAMSVQARAI